VGAVGRAAPTNNKNDPQNSTNVARRKKTRRKKYKKGLTVTSESNNVKVLQGVMGDTDQSKKHSRIIEKPRSC